jgi:hypothetical protein
MTRTHEEYWALFTEISELYAGLIKQTITHTVMSRTKDKVALGLMELFKQLHKDTTVGIT